MTIKSSSKTFISDFVIGESNFYLFDNLDSNHNEWDLFTTSDLYFSSAYLKIIESSPSLGIKPFYLMEYHNQSLVRVYYYQLKTFKLDESIGNETSVKNNLLKKNLSKLITFDTLINGNILLTGKYGVFDKNGIGGLDLAYLEKVNDMLCGKLKVISGKSFGGFLLKDFYNSDIKNRDQIKTYTECILHPNMILEISDHWKRFEDYLADLNTKYRTRYKRALKKLEGIEVREMQLPEMVTQKKNLHKLYQNIALGADFNLFMLPDDYFVRFKEVFGDNLIVKGYYKNEELVGFYTCLNNIGRLDAHFLGYNPEVNKESQLYLNMLFDMVDLAIQKSCKRVFMSRTAIEIKNSIGAIPHNMFCYFRHNNPIFNTVVRPLFEIYRPKEAYILRNPFKSETSVEIVSEDSPPKESCNLKRFVCKK